MPAVTTRVPQEERTRAMRARLMEATVELLVERGFAGTSTTLVSERAGVSRGAQLHHFPTKNDLVVGAVEHLTEVRGAELAAAAERDLPRGGRRTRAVLEMLADHFTSPVFTAALELWVAARTDQALREAVVPLEQRVGRQTHRMTVELLGVDESTAGARELVQATLDLVRGLGLADTITDDARRRKRILDRWAVTLDEALHANALLESVLADLAAEGDRLESLVAPLDAAGWHTPTPAEGWDVATVVAHLAWTDEAATVAATDEQAWHVLVVEALDDPDHAVDKAAAAGAVVPPDELLDRWRGARSRLAEVLRAYPGGQRMPWYGPPMSPTSMATARFMETWAHGLDVFAALGVEHEVSDRIRHVAHLGVRTRNFAFATHGESAPTEEFLVSLTAPSGEVWTWGPEDAAQTVTGSAHDFCLLVTQRIHRNDTDLVTGGADADHWLDIAQAFAGPSGEGRPPRG